MSGLFDFVFPSQKAFRLTNPSAWRKACLAGEGWRSCDQQTREPCLLLSSSSASKNGMKCISTWDLSSEHEGRLVWGQEICGLVSDSSWWNWSGDVREFGNHPAHLPHQVLGLWLIYFVSSNYFSFKSLQQETLYCVLCTDKPSRNKKGPSS